VGRRSNGAKAPTLKVADQQRLPEIEVAEHADCREQGRQGDAVERRIEQDDTEASGQTLRPVDVEAAKPGCAREALVNVENGDGKPAACKVLAEQRRAQTAGILPPAQEVSQPRERRRIEEILLVLVPLIHIS
jgi:hypothetical protein